MQKNNGSARLKIYCYAPESSSGSVFLHITDLRREEKYDYGIEINRPVCIRLKPSFYQVEAVNHASLNPTRIYKWINLSAGNRNRMDFSFNIP